MGFAAIARVTDSRWITCSTNDLISFGLEPGDELQLETTLCNEVRQSHQAIFIDHVAEDENYRNHQTPKIYNIQSYISMPIFRKNGEFFGTLCAIDPNPAKINTPEIVGMFTLFADLISFHLQSQEENKLIKSKLKEERQIAELRDQFIAILGHDLKNPVATTRMSADILLKTAKDELTQRHAALIKSTSYRMQGLIENILDFARGKLGEGITLVRSPQQDGLKGALQQIIKEIKTNSPEREIDLRVSIVTEVFCDKDRISQLFSNLISNADTHGAEDAPILVEAMTEGDKFVFSVTNAGEKIPEEARRLLFEPFYREGTGKKGLGLGLFIASEIAKAHHGELKVISNEEKTCFTFSMPLLDIVKREKVLDGTAATAGE